MLDDRLAIEMLRRVRNRAAKDNIPFALHLDDIRHLFQRSGGRCELTGIPFSSERIPKVRLRPFHPSVDRIDPNLGYHIDNVRLICVAANFALNTFGDAVFARLAYGLVSKGLRTAAQC